MEGNVFLDCFAAFSVPITDQNSYNLIIHSPSIMVWRLQELKGQKEESEEFV